MTRTWPWFILFVTAGALGQITDPVPGDEPATTPRSDLTLTYSIPLEDGQFAIGSVLGKLLDLVGLDGQAAREHIRLKFDATGAAARMQLETICQATRGVVWFENKPDRLSIHLDRLRLRREEKQLRSHLRGLVEQLFPRAAAKAAQRYGIIVHTQTQRGLKPQAATFGSRVVVLVHGLDEVGHLWRDLIPVLLDDGITVAEFSYPNDQPIEDSAALLADHLTHLHTLGVKRVALVAHSMGGLVCRWVLTDQKYYAGHGADAIFPSVSDLIMIGTPNHGSAMARLRFLGEARDQIGRFLSGDGLLFGSILDGAGEAEVDLLPDSVFLRELNTRTHPEGVTFTIIAGKASPVTRRRLNDLLLNLRPHLSDSANAKVANLIDAIGRLQDGLGDGVVSLESAQLKGVDDFVVVPANHLSMIRHILPDRDSVPAAVPIIMDRLNRRDGKPAQGNDRDRNRDDGT